MPADGRWYLTWRLKCLEYDHKLPRSSE